MPLDGSHLSCGRGADDDALAHKGIMIMIKTVSMMALAAAATVVAASPAFAEVMCTPSACTGSSSGSFVVSPGNVGPGFMGPISATIGDSGIAKGSFLDTFSFILPYTGVGGGSVTSTFSGKLLHTSGDLDFTGILVNGVAVAADIVNGRHSAATTDDLITLHGGANSFQISGYSYGNSSYGGNISTLR